jgi:hypothetical protein
LTSFSNKHIKETAKIDFLFFAISLQFYKFDIPCSVTLKLDSQIVCLRDLRSGSLLGQPQRFEPYGREITERRVNAFVQVHLIQELAELRQGIMIISIVRPVNLLVFDGADEAFGKAILPGMARCDETRADVCACNRCGTAVAVNSLPLSERKNWEPTYSQQDLLGRSLSEGFLVLEPDRKPRVLMPGEEGSKCIGYLAQQSSATALW